MQVQTLGREDPLEEEMATPSSILAWSIPWTEKPGRLCVAQSWTWLKRLSTHTSSSASFFNLNQTRICASSSLLSQISVHCAFSLGSPLASTNPSQHVLQHLGLILQSSVCLLTEAYRNLPFAPSRSVALRQLSPFMYMSLLLYWMVSTWG